ncbi:hypothetical protein [Streptomyces sp. 16-176A]|uniref:hypothetical protein n=1 Tax=Streptomyces sp. 16-176A TaxID=2530458 RepID=UPI00345DBBB8
MSRPDHTTSDYPAADWTAVRAVVGDQVEAILRTLDARDDAYAMIVPPLNDALTDPETRATVDTVGVWRAALDPMPASITVTRPLPDQTTHRKASR